MRLSFQLCGELRRVRSVDSHPSQLRGAMCVSLKTQRFTVTWPLDPENGFDPWTLCLRAGFVTSNQWTKRQLVKFPKTLYHLLPKTLSFATVTGSRTNSDGMLSKYSQFRTCFLNKKCFIHSLCHQMDHMVAHTANALRSTGFLEQYCESIIWHSVKCRRSAHFFHFSGTGWRTVARMGQKWWNSDNSRPRGMPSRQLSPQVCKIQMMKSIARIDLDLIYYWWELTLTCVPFLWSTNKQILMERLQVQLERFALQRRALRRQKLFVTTALPLASVHLQVHKESHRSVNMPQPCVWERSKQTLFGLHRSFITPSKQPGPDLRLNDFAVIILPHLRIDEVLVISPLSKL